MQYMANERTSIIYPYDEEAYEDGGYRPLTSEEAVSLDLDPTDEEYYEATRIPVPENMTSITRDFIMSMFNAYGDQLGKRIGNDMGLRDAQEEMLVRIIKFNQKQGNNTGEDLPLPEGFERMKKSQIEKHCNEAGISIDMKGSVSQVRARVVNFLQDKMDQEAA